MADGGHGGHGSGDANAALVAALSGVPIEQAMLQQRAQRAQSMLGFPGAQGQQIGQVYRAASPLEHLANALMRVKGGREMKGIEAGFGDLAQRAQAGAMARAQAQNEPAPPEWGAPPGARRSEAVASGWLRRPDPVKPSDPDNDPAPQDWNALPGMTRGQAIASGYAKKPEPQRPPSFPIIVGSEGYMRIDPRNPAAPALPIVDPAGKQVTKPAGGGHGAGASGLTMPDVVERKRQMLSDGQLKIVAQYDTGIETLKSLGEMKKGIDTGPLASRKNALAAKVGADDPQVSAFRAAVGDQLSAYIKGLSGAAVSDKERAFLIQNVPKMEDNDQVFEAKRALVLDRLQRLRDIEVELFGKQGKDVEAFRSGDGAAQPPDAAPRRRRYNPQTGMLE
jgi:hypothetical protein